MTPRLRRLLLLLPLFTGTLLPLGAARPVKGSAVPGIVPPTPEDAPLTPGQLAGVRALMGRANGFRLGLLIADAQTGRALYARRPDEPYTPASNMKLLSLSAALYTLGPDYWFSTSVTRPPGISAQATYLTLVGGGDPSLEANLGEHSLAGLARQVYAGGLRSVGDLRLDAHLIGAVAGQGEAGWRLPVVERPVSGLTLNDPSAGDGAELTTPPDARAAVLSVGAVFRSELERAGVKVTGKLVPGPASGPPEDGVATTRSVPLASLVRSAMKRSDNVWTEQLYARLGVNTQTPEWRPASLLHARAQQTRLLNRAGVNAAGLVIHDGSGLSAGDRLTPRALVGLLRCVYLRPVGSTLGPQAAFRERKNLFIEALPRAGTGTASEEAALQGGTLATRLPGLDVRAKTGTLPGVSALSGYLTTKSGRVLIFSVLMDNYGGPGQELRQLQDALLRALAADL